MNFVLLIYQGTTPLPGSDRWKALLAVEQKAMYADYAETNKAPGVTPGLPLGLPDAAMTVQVRDGKPQLRPGTYQTEGAAGYFVLEARAWTLRSRWQRGSQRPAWAVPRRFAARNSIGDAHSPRRRPDGRERLAGQAVR
jgi:hypothetical protein